MPKALILDTNNVRLLLVAFEETTVMAHSLFIDLIRSSAFGERAKRIEFEAVKARQTRLHHALSLALRGSTAILVDADAAYVMEIGESEFSDDDVVVTVGPSLYADDEREAARQVAFGSAVASWELPGNEDDATKIANLVSADVA